MKLYIDEPLSEELNRSQVVKLLLSFTLCSHYPSSLVANIMPTKMVRLIYC